MNPLVISRLIEHGYSIYAPIGEGEELILEYPSVRRLLRCICTNVSKDRENAPILRASRLQSLHSCDLVAACDSLTRTVWLVPSEELEGKTMIRLGQRYEQHVIPEPLSKDYQQQKIARNRAFEGLRESALAVAEALVEKASQEKPPKEASHEMEELEDEQPE